MDAASANTGGQKPKPKGSRGRRGGGRKVSVPDILYHACDEGRAQQAIDSGALSLSGGRKLFMSKSESQAWLVAHRGSKHPRVLYVDAARAKQNGTHLHLNNRGLWQASAVPVRHVLNLREGFGHQHSAGGFPVFYGPSGPEIALIKVKRRFGATWEIAKGKLEPGESPVQCAMRELQEEMGASLDLTLEADFGFARFGFMTPDREPRLKTMYVYQFACANKVTDFNPAEKESVVDVGWFKPAQADKVIKHRSLRPLMRRLLQNLKNR